MEREEFEKRFKLRDGDNYIIVELADSAFYVDDYLLLENGKYVNLYWKGVDIGYCRLSKVKEVM